MRVLLGVLTLIVGLASTGLLAAGQEGPKVNWQIRHAYKIFSQMGATESTHLANERLRLYVLRTRKQQTVSEQRDRIVAHKYAPAFINQFDAAVAWRRQLDADDGLTAFSLSAEYEQRQGDKIFSHIAASLLRLAVRKEYPPALKKWAAKYLASEDGDKRKLGCSYLKSAAEKGDVEAALSLGRMYKAGDVLKQDHARALFWFSKALKNHIATRMPNWQDTLYELQSDGQYVPAKGGEEKLAQFASEVSPHLEGWIEYVLQRTSPQDWQWAYLTLRADDMLIGCLIQKD